MAPVVRLQRRLRAVGRRFAKPLALPARRLTAPAARLPAVGRFASAGFTLLEAMLALAIMGVLAIIGVGAYDRYAEKARVYRASMDIGGLQVLIRQFELDNGTFPTTLADIGAAGRLDPWGRAYVYVDLTSKKGKGAARKDHKLNPINSDFDLYSVGKDGQTKTQVSHKLSLDDVIRGNDGKFIGLGRDF